MQVYGYTKVNSEGGYNGKESKTEIFESMADRNDFMYKDYRNTFGRMASEEEFEKENGKYVDANGNPEMSKTEFMQEIKKSRDADNDVFGIIQAYGYHVQFEPFGRPVG